MTVKAQTTPSRADMFWMKYSTMMQLIGVSDANTVPKNSTVHTMRLSE
jgi:hypothetical protein